MMDWYLTREEGNLIHRGIAVKKGKKIHLTEQQADLHGLKVVKTSPPKTKSEAAIGYEWDLYMDTLEAQAYELVSELANNKEKIEEIIE